MSDSETPENEDNSAKTEDVVATEAKKTNNLLASVMELKNSNPKVFFGAIAAVVILVLIIMLSSEGSSKLPSTAFKDLVVGQQYSLKGANSTDEKSTISMVAVPGTIAAFDDEHDEEGSDRSCKQQPEETKVKVIDLQDFAGKKNVFAHVEVLSEGHCQGRKGWVLAIDMQ